MKPLNKHPFNTIVDHVIDGNSIGIYGDLNSGKTFIAQQIAQRYINDDTEVLVIDHKGDWRDALVNYVDAKTVINTLLDRKTQGRNFETLVIIIDDYNSFLQHRRNILDKISPNKWKKLKIIPVITYLKHRNIPHLGSNFTPYHIIDLYRLKDGRYNINLFNEGENIEITTNVKMY